MCAGGSNGPFKRPGGRRTDGTYDGRKQRTNRTQRSGKAEQIAWWAQMAASCKEVTAVRAHAAHGSCSKTAFCRPLQQAQIRAAKVVSPGSVRQLSCSAAAAARPPQLQSKALAVMLQHLSVVQQDHRVACKLLCTSKQLGGLVAAHCGSALRRRAGAVLQAAQRRASQRTGRLAISAWRPAV